MGLCTSACHPDRLLPQHRQAGSRLHEASTRALRSAAPARTRKTADNGHSNRRPRPTATPLARACRALAQPRPEAAHAQRSACPQPRERGGPLPTGGGSFRFRRSRCFRVSGARSPRGARRGARSVSGVGTGGRVTACRCPSSSLAWLGPLLPWLGWARPGPSPSPAPPRGSWKLGLQREAGAGERRHVSTQPLYPRACFGFLSLGVFGGSFPRNTKL